MTLPGSRCLSVTTLNPSDSGFTKSGAEGCTTRANLRECRIRLIQAIKGGRRGSVGAPTTSLRVGDEVKGPEGDEAKSNESIRRRRVRSVMMLRVVED